MIRAALFDFDGVIANTEPLYDLFWNEAADRYRIGIPHFASRIKGTIMPHIMATYFSNHSEEERQRLQQECDQFELNMDYTEIPGAKAFIQELQNQNILVALVTSSKQSKIERALKELALEQTFDTIVTADRITKGKPDPYCYQLAAKDLNISPSECLVLEDSLAGIAAGTAAGMKVIGLSTTLPADRLAEKVHRTIPDFTTITWTELCDWL
ncbi:MAG: HAD family phosphatase [Bacteroidales bacterium]|nr:HAD family phosphatase [Bacteroidales bacterium]MDD4821330.1 HAD family phosphatase [Bacteroidales bacterium]